MTYGLRDHYEIVSFPGNSFGCSRHAVLIKRSWSLDHLEDNEDRGAKETQTLTGRPLKRTRPEAHVLKLIQIS